MFYYMNLLYELFLVKWPIFWDLLVKHTELKIYPDGI